MGFRTVLVLLLLAGGLFAALWFTDRKPPVERVAETAVLDGRSLLECKTMAWQQRDRLPLEIGRLPDGRFALQEPIADVASAAYLRNIVTTWDSAQMQRTPIAADADGLARTGLAAPELRFTAEWPDGHRIEIAIGEAGALGEARFLLRDGLVWEGGEGLYESLQAGIDDLRERVVFRNSPVEVRELRVEQKLPTGKRESLHLVLDGTEWRLKQPVEGRADPVAAQRFVTAVASLRVDDFIPGQVRYPDREPDVVVEVRGTRGEETVRLWDEGGALFGRLPDRGVTFGAGSRQYDAVFVNAVEELRARILLPLGESSFEELFELVVDPGQGRGDRLRLVRAGVANDWRLVEPVEFPAHPTPCNEAAYALQRLVAREFVTGAGVAPPDQPDRYGLSGERLSLTVRSGDRRELATLWVGNELERNGERLAYACRSDEPHNVALVLAEPVDTLRRPWTDYCDRQVVRQTAIVERLELAHRDGRERAFVNVDGRWRVEGEERDRTEVGELANDELRDLVGQTAVDMREGKGFAAEPDFLVLLMRRNGDELARIEVWDRGGDTALVVRGNRAAPVGFELSKRLSGELRALWN